MNGERTTRACDCCGGRKGLQLLRAEACADGERCTIALCVRCRESPARAWRLRWRLLERSPIDPGDYRIEVL